MALADLDRDGYGEILSPSQDGRLYMLRADRRLVPGFPSPPLGSRALHATPAVADLDGDGDLEILIAGPTGTTGSIYAWHHDGKLVSGFPWRIGPSFYNGLTLGDLDGDGFLDLAWAGGKALWAWTSSFRYDPTRIAWGAYRRTRTQNGVVDFSPTDGVPSAVVAGPPAVQRGNILWLRLALANRSRSPWRGTAELLLTLPQGGQLSFFGRVPLALPPGIAGQTSFPLPVPAALAPGGYVFPMLLRWPSGRPVFTDSHLVTVR